MRLMRSGSQPSLFKEIYRVFVKAEALASVTMKQSLTARASNVNTALHLRRLQNAQSVIELIYMMLSISLI